MTWLGSLLILYSNEVTARFLSLPEGFLPNFLLEASNSIAGRAIWSLDLHSKLCRGHGTGLNDLSKQHTTSDKYWIPSGKLSAVVRTFSAWLPIFVLSRCTYFYIKQTWMTFQFTTNAIGDIFKCLVVFSVSVCNMIIGMQSSIFQGSYSISKLLLFHQSNLERLIEQII